jgi:hypothetical protein
MALEYVQYAGPSMAKVIEYLDTIDEPLPNALLSVGFGLEDKGEIKALSLIQSLPFIEPFHAQPGYGHHLKTLFDMTREFIIGSQAKRIITHSQPKCAIADRLKKEPGVIVMTDEFYDWRR